ncbi:conserved Plasmodium protein, unknown function [Plasmodium gallinaceum]|uniref:Uncharacterized protein n=1 Tax=Plasmodium gallinaceum TaxID=5849 RepID=A0A1J1GRY2_PLAGA|nr:conserved Plasmodium protein, unknown function [Plasmodium gallinaceum]CRG95230.1 conserved Plasmodium protein, unknown function [Plasmodium gallinaceum]
MNDFHEEYDFMKRIHKLEGTTDYIFNNETVRKKKDDILFDKEKYEKGFFMKSKYDKYSNGINDFEKENKLIYLKKLKNENEKEQKKKEKELKRNNINELTKVNEIVYYIHANKRNVYEYITNHTDLENNYYQIEEKPKKLSRNIIKENEEYVYLNDNAYYKLKINKEEKEPEEEEKEIEKMKIKYTTDENKNNLIENVVVSDNILVNISNIFFSLKHSIKNIFLFLNKLFHYDFLDYPYLKNYSFTNYFDRNVKEYIKYIKKTEDTKLIDQDFLSKKKYFAPFFIYNCVDCNYNTNDNGIIILSSILPFVHNFDYDYKLKQTRDQEEELDKILNNEKNKSSNFIEQCKKIKNFILSKLYPENKDRKVNSNSEYSEFLKKFENSINEEGELIQDILFSGKVQMIFINFKQLENNFNNVIGNIEIKNERVEVSNLILGYEKREHIKYTDILVSNILKNIKKKYPNLVINDENPKQFLYDLNELSQNFSSVNSNEYIMDNKKDIENKETNKKELMKLSDLRNYIYNSPSYLMKENNSNCEYVTCVCFDNNSNNCNLINNFVLGYNTGKVEYIYGKIVYSNISHCDLLIDYYSKKNKKFSYELNKRIFLNGSIVKILFAPNGFFCLILTSKTLYLCNFFYFSIYEIKNTCYNSQFVNFIWINNNSYSVFNSKGNVYIYEKNLKNEGFNNFSLTKTFFINQSIYFNSICEYHLYSNCIYLYTGEIEKKKKKSDRTFFKKKKKQKSKMNDYFYKYDCNFIIIDLNSDIHKSMINNKNKEIDDLLKDNISDIENNMKQIKILEKLIENGNNLEDEDFNFEKLLYINIKDFNNYISTIKDINNNLYMPESGDENMENILENDNTKKDFSLKNFFINYINDVKKYLYNLKNENIINILLPRYYSCADDYDHNNFLSIRFFTIEKSDNKHLIALDTETDYVYIYKIRKNVYLDEETINLLKNTSTYKNNPLQTLHSSSMKKEHILKDEWKIYNDYIYINTKKSVRYIKYNLLYIIKNHRKVFFPLHVYVINTKPNENEYFLFIKWATIKNSFIYSSYNSLNRISKMKDYFKKTDDKLLKVLENQKNIFLYNINDNDYPYIYMNPYKELTRKGKLMEKEYSSENGDNYLYNNKNKLNEYKDNTNYINNDEYLNKTPIKSTSRNFFTSPIGNMNTTYNPHNNILYNLKPNKYNENDMYNDYYINKDSNFSNIIYDKKQNEPEKKWSYLKKINIFKKDDALDDYSNNIYSYNNTNSKHMQNKNPNIYNLEDNNILNDIKNPNFFPSSNTLNFNKLHNNSENNKIVNDDNTTVNEFFHSHNSNHLPSNNSNNNYDPFLLKNDFYNYRNLNMNINSNNTNSNNTYMANDFYSISNKMNLFSNDFDKTNSKLGYIYDNKDITDLSKMDNNKYNSRNRFKNINENDNYSSRFRKYM